MKPTYTTARRDAEPPPYARGYLPTYREGETNYCPGCARTHWWVGRHSAECGFCGTALPLRTGGRYV